VREAVGGLTTLELGLFDVISSADGSAGWGATGASPLQLGAAIAIYTGSTATPQKIFDGWITAIEGEYSAADAPLFTILGEDKLWKARRKRRSRLFEQKSPADLVRQVAQDHGLTPQVRDGLDQPTADWAQINESDLGFLRRILDRFDADVQAVDNDLQAGPRARDNRLQAELTLTIGAKLVRARITADLADQATSVVAAGYDSAAGEAVKETATQGTAGPGHGKDGASVLRDKFDAVIETVGHEDALTSREAQAMAKALYGQRARRFVLADCTAQGNAQIRVGSWVTLAGVNPFFANVFSVTEAVHRFDQANGYLTDFRAECAYLGAGA
jgi:phage protein D